VRKRLIAFLLSGLVVLVPACSNTAEGLEEDANRNIDEVQQEVDEEQNDDDDDG
jgi:predicted small secreted protein